MARLQNMLDLCGRIFQEDYPIEVPLIKADPVLQKVSDALISPDSYEEVKNILKTEEFTEVSKSMFVACLIATVSMDKGGDFIFHYKQLSDIPRLAELIDLLKYCLEMNCSFNSPLLSLLLRFTPLLLDLYEEVGFDSKSGVGADKENAFNLGSLSSVSYERFFDYAVKNGHDPNKKSLCISGSWDNTALHSVIANEESGMLIALVERCIAANLKLDLTIKDREGKNPLTMAAKMRDYQSLKYLREKWQTYPELFKVDLSACDNDGHNGLHYGCMYKERNIIDFFIRYVPRDDKPQKYLLMTDQTLARKTLQSIVIDPDRPFKTNKPSEVSFLSLFSFFLKPEKPKTFIEVCFSDESFSSAVMLALKRGMFRSMESFELVFRHVAAKSSDQTTLMTELLHTGIDLNATGKSGNTALHFAARSGNLSHVKWLIANRVCLKENAEHKTAFDLCADDRIKSILLQHFGSRIEPERSSLYSPMC